MITEESERPVTKIRSEALDRELLEDSLSQKSNYSEWENDISELILAFDENPPNSTASSSSLGKRKADDSPSSSSVSYQDLRPAKFTKPAIDPENPFIVSPATIEPPTETDPIVISSARHQRCFEKRKLPYLCHFEIARLSSCGRLRYEDIEMDLIDRLAKMKSNDVAVPMVGRLLLKTSGEYDLAGSASFAKEIAAKDPCKEFDREEEALQSNPYGALGVNPEYPGWHGGQVHFRGILGIEGGEFKLKLERAELGPSDHFARRFGSKNFFRVHLSNSVYKERARIFDYLARPLVLCDGVFRAYFAKDNSVFYVKTNETFNGSAISRASQADPVQGNYSFLEFVNWHNALASKPSQTMAKWASRFALGLSNSAPGFLVDKSRLIIGSDIVSGTGSEMTDGAGTINRAGLLVLRHKFLWEETPSAVQVRICGGKGLLVLDRDDLDDRPRITLSPSQIKICYSQEEFPDPARLIVDVLRYSRTKTPCRLSVETIINLADNGVPRLAFLKLLKQGLDELVQPLLSWEGNKAMQALWCTLRRIGGVMVARRSREEVGLSRVRGFSERDLEETEIDDEDSLQIDAAIEQRSSAWWGDEFSGCPSSLEETVMSLIDSGFTPDNCPVLRSKLEKIVKSRVTEYTRSYRIDVPMSATAFLVPDIHGVLEPGEIFFKCSKRQLRGFDGLETDLITGDVLVTRHPCKLPTDVQKWKAVDKAELYYLTDVIVCSTKGERRAADFLAGGDYDGDKGTMIWQPELVEPFKSADIHFADPPEDIEKYFPAKNELVSDFLSRTRGISDELLIRELQRYLLNDVVRDTSVVGKYSIFHEHATYTLGYRHPETKRLAYMFCMALDGSKSGMTVLPEVLAKDTKKYNYPRLPLWKETEEEKERFIMQGRNEVHPKRPSSLGSFIMDELHQQADEEGNKRLRDIQVTFETKRRYELDSDLESPWRTACDRSKRWEAEEGNACMRRELDKLEEHVRSVYAQHREALAIRGSPKKATMYSPKKKSKHSFTGQPIEVRQDTFRRLSRQFSSYPAPGELLTMSDEEIARVRASYAYVYDAEKNSHREHKFTRFPWDVAMRELAAIKARATGRYKTVSGDFYDEFNIKHPHKHHT